MTCDDRRPNGERRALPLGEHCVEWLGSPQTSCTGAKDCDAWTPGRQPASVCMYGEVRRQPTWSGMTRRAGRRRASGRGSTQFDFDLAMLEQLKLKILLQK
jgi:hypothetical protein